MPTITVIIAAYQAAGTLGAALASIAAQSRPADQVVVVDDGSADGTAEVAEAWAPLLPVTVIRKAVNEGVGLARRDAVATSSGDLVAMIDADDYWLPDHLAVCLASFEEHGGIVSAKGVRWVPGQVLGTTPWDALSPVPRPEDQRREILRRNFLLSAVLFSRDAYDEAGGFVDLRCDEDWDLWIKMIRLGHLVTVPATVTVLSRNRP